MKKKSRKSKKTSNKEEEFKKFDKRLILGIAVVILVAIAVFLVFSSNEKARQGDTVIVDYTVSANNSVFDTSKESVARKEGVYKASKDYEPIEITIGSGKFLKGFEDALYMMEEGSAKTFTIPPELAYGKYDPRNIATFPLEEINNSEEIEEGTMLKNRQGTPFEVVNVNETHAFVDLNHPLAGKNLTFWVKLLEIK